MYVTDAEAAAIKAHVGRLEARTGVQVVTAVVGTSDDYPELPWKAFAAGTSFSGLALVVFDVAAPHWVTATTVLVWIATMLAVAATSALLAAFVPSIARVFLAPARRVGEVRQRAASLFLEHEVFRTTDRVGVLVFVSLFERAVHVVADTGYRGRVDERAWDAVVAAMTPCLVHDRPAVAVERGLEALDALLVAHGFTPGAAVSSNELPDQPIEERGI